MSIKLHCDMCDRVINEDFYQFSYNKTPIIKTIELLPLPNLKSSYSICNICGERIGLEELVSRKNNEFKREYEEG